ncbi:hypothetical protein HK102_006865 [Quaeritorhiza haematococci]|nr:hypothetical protein HK102_006865 [Quaeritorhiza haematococci]
MLVNPSVASLSENNVKHEITLLGQDPNVNLKDQYPFSREDLEDGIRSTLNRRLRESDIISTYTETLDSAFLTTKKNTLAT